MSLLKSLLLLSFLCTTIGACTHADKGDRSPASETTDSNSTPEDNAPYPATHHFLTNANQDLFFTQGQNLQIFMNNDDILGDTVAEHGLIVATINPGTKDEALLYLDCHFSSKDLIHMAKNNNAQLVKHFQEKYDRDQPATRGRVRIPKGYGSPRNLKKPKCKKITKITRKEFITVAEDMNTTGLNKMLEDLDGRYTHDETDSTLKQAWLLAKHMPGILLQGLKERAINKERNRIFDVQRALHTGYGDDLRSHAYKSNFGVYAFREGYSVEKMKSDTLQLRTYLNCKAANPSNRCVSHSSSTR
ncbi:MAG: hypothetical protein KDD33_00110 [Bdellovibrionales bacterium]|nr:hypothetical protein [Bdellovibrionales bacterium]